jgi:GT2 family glycosyltransferase
VSAAETDRPLNLSVLIVAHDSREDLARTLPALLDQLEPDDELIVVDNASSDGSAELVADFAPEAKVVRSATNLGFPAGINAAAAGAGGELLLILNPDAMPHPGFREAIVRPAREERGWAAWMGLVACNGATEVNTAGNPLHFTGITWAGGHGRPLAQESRPHEITIASGACLAVTRSAFERLGGMPEPYFLYHEDVDLSMRLHLAGEKVGIEPGAIVDHDYEFLRDFQKMRLLERNRWLFVLRAYPAVLLALVMPALLLTELALIPVSVAGRWGREKLLANLGVLRHLGWALRSRREVQRGRSVSVAEFAAWLTPELDSPFLGRAAHSRLLGWGLRAYWRLVRALLP